jgi:hypothetical protein
VTRLYGPGETAFKHRAGEHVAVRYIYLTDEHA